MVLALSWVNCSGHISARFVVCNRVYVAQAGLELLILLLLHPECCDHRHSPLCPAFFNVLGNTTSPHLQVQWEWCVMWHLKNPPWGSGNPQDGSQLSRKHWRLGDSRQLPARTYLGLIVGNTVRVSCKPDSKGQTDSQQLSSYHWPLPDGCAYKSNYTQSHREHNQETLCSASSFPHAYLNLPAFMNTVQN